MHQPREKKEREQEREREIEKRSKSRLTTRTHVRMYLHMTGDHKYVPESSTGYKWTCTKYIQKMSERKRVVNTNLRADGKKYQLPTRK